MSQDRRAVLQTRLDENYKNYLKGLQKKPLLKIIKMASEITAAQQFCDKLVAVCDDADIEALLTFDDPLDLMLDCWKWDIGNYDHGEEMVHVHWDFLKQEILPAISKPTEKHYKDDVPLETAPRETAEETGPEEYLRKYPRENFERMVQQIIPSPDAAVTEAWYSYCMDLTMDCGPGYIEEFISNLGYIAKNFSTETAQKVYDIIQFSWVLPDELTAAAVYLQSGITSHGVAELSESGKLMGFYTARAADETSSLALLSVVENGEKSTFYTLSFGRFQPEDALQCGREYAAEKPCSVAKALQSFRNIDLRIKYDVCRNLYTGDRPEMTEAMLAIFKTCPAVAAHITINADTGEITTDLNPLWQKARERELPKLRIKKARKKRKER